MPLSLRRGAVGGRRILIIGLALSSLLKAAFGQPAAVVYNPITEARPFRAEFKIGFWQDPDLSPNARESLKNRLRPFSIRMIEKLGPTLAECGFTDLGIYLIEDYRLLHEERLKGDFDLLHCDQAVYLVGKQYLPPGAREWEPYEVIAEEVLPEGTRKAQAGIWVREDSPIRKAAWLSGKKGRHFALVDDNCLLGGALQMARLAGLHPSPLSATKEDYFRTSCGSVTDAILRLLTGIANETPIEAAFLPVDSAGFLKARKALGLAREEDLPIRLLESFEVKNPPGPPLLATRFLLECRADLRTALTDFLSEQRSPWRWRESEASRYQELEEEIAPLFRWMDRQP